MWSSQHHTRTFPITAPSAAPDGRAEARREPARRSGLYIPRACAAGAAHGAHLAPAHEHACAPAPPVAGSRSYLRGSPGAGPTRPYRLPLLFPPWSAHRSQSLPHAWEGSRDHPPLGHPGGPHSRRHPGVWSNRGLGARVRLLPHLRALPTGPGRAGTAGGGRSGFSGQPAAGTPALMALGLAAAPGTRPLLPRRPNRGLCVSAGGAASRATAGGELRGP